MKNKFLLAILCTFTTMALYGQGSFGWNKAHGLGIGYSKIFQGFDTQYEGIVPPQDLIHFDLTIFGVYAGIDFMVKDTGYDVYGYSEKLDTWAFKIGPSFKYSNSNKWRFIFTPYAGLMFYSLFDGSNNSIGARDDYGTKETKFLGGGRISVVYDWYYLGIHCSNKEYGITLGIEFDLDDIGL